jgi:cytochrome bd-type quinol oxidase subunit 1
VTGLVSLGTVLSAAFFMAANSWMQHPVGYVMHKAHQPQLNTGLYPNVMVSSTSAADNLTVHNTASGAASAGRNSGRPD